jgi:uncharacterized protein YndB with AHSA1/START domain
MPTFLSSPDIPALPRDVFAAICDPVRPAPWWGPAGFGNTFQRCEFRAGGSWPFVMHGPDGTSYPNESVFADIGAPEKGVIGHISMPRFRLAIVLKPKGGGTTIHREQSFADEELALRMEPVVVPANEQKLDRLVADVAAAKD